MKIRMIQNTIDFNTVNDIIIVSQFTNRSNSIELDIILVDIISLCLNDFGNS